MNSKLHRSGGFLNLLIVVIMVAAFVTAALLGISWFGARQERMEGVVTQMGVGAFGRIERFLMPVDSLLVTMQQWGAQGLLNLDDPVQITRSVIPLIDKEQLRHISAVIVAQPDGRSYTLFREADSWLSRSVNGEAAMIRWRNLEKVEQWSEESDYDPRQRPWYVGVARQEIFWTRPYQFMTQQKPGVTASVAVQGPANGIAQVIAVDVLLEDYRGLLGQLDLGDDGHIFLLSANGQVADLTRVHDKLPATRPNVGLFGAFLAHKGGNPFRFRYENRSWWGWISDNLTDEREVHLALVMPESSLIMRQKGSYLLLISVSVLVVGMAIVLVLAILYRRQLGKDEGFSEERLLDLISQGEGEQLEFKSTLRWNLETGQPGKEIEFVIVKTIAAFLNTDGGILLVGVGDDGAVLGMDADGFQSDDKCLLHLNNMFKRHIGLEYAGCIRFELCPLAGKKILVVECLRSEQPIFFKHQGNEEFYIRVGPGSRKLSPSEVLEYMKNR